MPIPACFCAIHSAEDAVAAFISSAKEYGYDDARMTKIKDHVAKATVSLLAQKISGILRIGRYQVAVALNPKTQALAARYIADGQTHCNEALTKLPHFHDEQEKILPDFYDELANMFGDVTELKTAVRIGQEARATVFYASRTGYPTGLDEPNEPLARECHLTLGLIWAAIDTKQNGAEKIPLIELALQTANIVIAELKRR